MKKNILIPLFIFTTFMQGMEPNPPHKITKESFTLTSHGTTINLVQGSWIDALATTDIIVIGNHHQAQSEKCLNISHMSIGAVFTSCYSCTHNQKKYNLTKMFIEEPYLQQPLDYYYYVLRKNQSYRGYSDYQTIPYTFEGNQAIQEASQDLILCYNIALTKGLELLKDNPTKNITFTQLSTEVGFPKDEAAPIAVETIFDFIQKNPGYTVINLLVKKSPNWAHYKKILLQHSGILHNICLFSWKENEHDTALSVLPRELIKYIVSLI